MLFIPYARPGGISHDDYTDVARSFFQKIEIEVTGIHTYNDSVESVSSAKGIFVGGGNTFVLLNELYKNRVLGPLRNTLINGTPYLGTSAGANILGPSIRTSNDMPIVYPPSFDALNVVPFQINPHYIDVEIHSKHMGETRETRIREFLKFNSISVTGIREGSYFMIKDGRISLGGDKSIRLFPPVGEPLELGLDQDIQFLLEKN